MTETLQFTGFSPAQWTPFEDALGQLGIDVPEGIRPPLEILYTELIAYNENVNLTRITDPEGFLLRHILDSLTILPYLPEIPSAPTGCRLIDVGSGAGFPALPVALFRPDIAVTALEATGKKAAFIQAMQEKLALSNLTVVTDRAELLAKKEGFRESFDIATARAVARLPMLLEYCLPFVKSDGLFLALKGTSFEAELKDSAGALNTLRGRHRESAVFKERLPNLPALADSVLLVFEKTGATPAAYPRPSAHIQKKPL